MAALTVSADGTPGPADELRAAGISVVDGR